MEIDLVIENGRELSLYEIKASMSYSPDFAKSLEKARKAFPEVKAATVVYAGNAASLQGIEYTNFRAAFA